LIDCAGESAARLYNNDTGGWVKRSNDFQIGSTSYSDSLHALQEGGEASGIERIGGNWASSQTGSATNAGVPLLVRDDLGIDPQITHKRGMRPVLQQPQSDATEKFDDERSIAFSLCFIWGAPSYSSNS
jgi:hypothetical protein